MAFKRSPVLSRFAPLIRTRLPLAFAALAVASACSRPSFDDAAEAQVLLKRDREWAALAAAGKDPDAVAAFWTADALVYPPGRPILEGRAAIRAYVAESFKIQGFRIHWVSEKPSFAADGKMAYMRSTNEITVPDSQGTPMTISARGVTVWRLEPDGHWRCAVDIWNDGPKLK